MTTTEDNQFGHDMIKWVHSEGALETSAAFTKRSPTSSRSGKQALQSLASTAIAVGGSYVRSSVVRATWARQEWDKLQRSLQNLAS